MFGTSGQSAKTRGYETGTQIGHAIRIGTYLKESFRPETRTIRHVQLIPRLPTYSRLVEGNMRAVGLTVFFT